MKNAIIIHGMPTKQEYDTTPNQSQQHWLPWIKQQLEAQKIITTVPDMPMPYAPVYEEWKDTFECILLSKETILVGHSCGGGFLVRWLSEHDVKVGQLILVAPWIDIEKKLPNGFFDFEIDTNLLIKTMNGISMFYSADDDVDILQSVEKLKTIQGIKIREFSNKGHFVKGSGVSEFPELLEGIKY